MPTPPARPPGAAVIVHQHDPDHPALREPCTGCSGQGCVTPQRSTMPRRPQTSPGHGSAMRALAVKDADQQLADLLQTLMG